jgi:hypothetical protein
MATSRTLIGMSARWCERAISGITGCRDAQRHCMVMHPGPCVTQFAQRCGHGRTRPATGELHL